MLSVLSPLQTALSGGSATVSRWIDSAPQFAYDNRWGFATAAAVTAGTAAISRYVYVKHIRDKIIWNRPIPFNDDIPLVPDYQKRKHLGYPTGNFNAWYHLCDSEELKIGQVLEIHYVGQVLALWRNDEGKPVCQEAFCPHLGS